MGIASPCASLFSTLAMFLYMMYDVYVCGNGWMAVVIFGFDRERGESER